MKIASRFSGAVADRLGAQKIQELADVFAQASGEPVGVKIVGPSTYHEGKVFAGRINPPPPYQSWAVEARVVFRVTARTIEEALADAPQYLENDDLVGSYSDVRVLEGEEELLGV